MSLSAYTDRIDAHLPKLADDAARRAFLTGQISVFEAAYVDFQRAAAEGRAPADVRAADFLETIAMLGARLPEVRHAA